MKRLYFFCKKQLLGPVCLLAFLIAPLTGAQAQLYINEIMTGNSSYKMDPTYNYSGWVEFYNAGSTSVSLWGHYLSDDPSQPKKYRIANTSKRVPAKGFLVYWFDHNDLSSDQANFKLNHEGGELTLYNASGLIVAKLEYPEQIQNVSYARNVDGTGEFGYCPVPTFEGTNAGSVFSYERCPEPTFSLKGGVYKNTCNVKIECPAGMQIRYTTDCTEPTSTSLTWISGTTKSFSSTTIIRARVMGSGYMNGAIVTQSYIISSREHTLPVTSIVTDPKNLWDDMIGIYVRGTNGIPGKGQGAVNWNRDWARPSNFELLHNTEQLFSQECDIAIGGGWTRANNLKSLKLNAEKKFDGKNRFDYSFFTAKPHLKFKSLSLRNSGNDWNSTMMSDAMQQSLIEGALDIEYQAYQPTIHYLNGQYYGIINLRERNNQQYVYSNFGYDKDSLDVIEKVAPSEGNYEVLNGTIEALDNLANLSADAASATVYKQIEQLMDIDEYIAYMIVEMYSGNWDWPVNNTKLFRHRNNGKFRWVLYDLEGGFQNTNYNPFSGEGNSLMSSACDNVHTVRIFRNLIKNETFKQRFIDYFTLILGSVYQPERVAHIVDSIAATIRPEIPYNRSKWGTTGNFEGGVSWFKTFANGRPDALLRMIKNFFSLGDAVRLDISSNLPHATLSMNDIPVPLGASDGYTFKGKEITVKAEAPSGYTFKAWNVMKEGGGQVVTPYGGVWSYYDKGSLDGTNWQQPSYNASSWLTGGAPLGYEKDGIVTVLDYGPDAQNKRPTSYMRHSFELAELSSNDKFTLDLTIDDGAIVYLNGTEVARYQLQSGTVTYSTFATSHAVNNPDLVTFSIPASAFKPGTNLLAVEVHQNKGNSTDMYLDLQITQQNSSSPSESYPDSEVTFTADGALVLQAEFSKNEEDPEKPFVPIRINEVSASNSTYINEYFKSEDWIELYNTTDQPVSIAGLYISREPENPKQYQIPATPDKETIIPPYGYRILWADKMDDINQLHLPFKLAAEGGTLTLTCMKKDAGGNETKLWSDQLTYTPHTDDHTFGRYPDGSDSLFIMYRTSLAASNIFSFYSISVPNEVGPPVSIEEITTGSGLDESGIALYYNASSMELIVEMQEEYTSQQPLFIYNLPGQIMGKYAIPAGQTNYTLYLGDLPAGYHIAVLHTPSGQKVTFRFIR